MPTLTVKNIPQELYERLKQSARVNHRSINSEVIACLEQTLFARKASPEEILARARVLRERTAGYPITDDEFSSSLRAGHDRG